MSGLIRLIRDQRASSAAEFALVVPLLLVLLFGIIEVGRYLFTVNEIEKATQMGVRYAVVSNPVATIVNNDFVNNGGIAGGDPVPTSSFGSATCSSTGNCTVTGSVTGNGRDATAFTNIVTWMQKFYPGITAAKVSIRYDNVGLGYSGDPTGPDVSPLVTVQVDQLDFNSPLLFGATFKTPKIKASLTMEDGSCGGDDPCGSSN